MCPPYLKGIEHHGTLQASLLTDTLLHALVNFLPKTGNTAHHRGADLLDGHLDVLWTEINTDLSAALQADIGPAAFEDVRQRQEVHRNVFVRQRRDTDFVRTEGFHVVVVHQHDAFWFACRARSVQNVGNVAVGHFCCAFLYFGFVRQPLAQCKELVEVDGHRLVAGVFLHLAVEDDNLLERRTHAEHTDGGVVLKLFANEEVTDAGIVDDILRLCRRTGGIKRDGDSTVGIGAEVHVKTFGFVLREDADVFLNFHTQRQQGIGHLAHCLREFVPGDSVPLCFFIVPVFQGYFISILLRLAVYHDGQMMISHVCYKIG